VEQKLDLLACDVLASRSLAQLDGWTEQAARDNNTKQTPCKESTATTSTCAALETRKPRVGDARLSAGRLWTLDLPTTTHQDALILLLLHAPHTCAQRWQVPPQQQHEQHHQHDGLRRGQYGGGDTVRGEGRREDGPGGGERRLGVCARVCRRDVVHSKYIC